MESSTDYELHPAIEFYSFFFLWSFALGALGKGLFAVWHHEWLFGLFFIVIANRFAYINGKMKHIATREAAREPHSSLSRRQLSDGEMNALINAMISAGFAIVLVVVVTFRYYHHGWLASLAYGVGAWVVWCLHLAVFFALFTGFIILLSKVKGRLAHSTANAVQPIQ